MKLFHVLFLVILILSSCKKDNHSQTGKPDCQQEPTIYINPEIAKFKFKVGTYWIYIDPVYPIVDTLRVMTVTTDGIIDGQYCPNNKYELYQFKVNQLYFGTNGYDTFSLYNDKMSVNQIPVEPGGIYSTSSQKIDSLFIYDRYYKSVVVATDFHSYGSIKYYFNSDYWLLKRELYDNTGNIISQRLLKDKFIVR